MKLIYEESNGNYGDAGVSVCVLKAESRDAPVTPRYLVALYSFQQGEQILPSIVGRDFEVIRWAQAKYDTLKADVADQ